MRTRTLGLALLLLLALPVVAAHSLPSESHPAAGERLDSAPSAVVITFTEPVYERGTWVQVIDSAGDRVDNADLVIGGPEQTPELRITLRDGLPDGAYRVGWQTYSRADGHVRSGIIGFGVGGYAAPASMTEDSGDLQGVSAIGRAVQYAGFALAFGVIAFFVFFRTGQEGLAGSDEDHLLLDRAMVGAATLLTVGLLIVLADTIRQTGIFAYDYLGIEGGRALVARTFVAGVILELSSRWRNGRLRATWLPYVIAGLWVFAALLSARFGHASTEGLWAVLVQWVHVVAISAWVGVVALFFVFLARRDGDAWALGGAVGRVAFWAVVGVAVTGVILSLAILGGGALQWRYWAATGWGRILVAKLVLATVMVVLAAINRSVFLAAEAEGTGPVGAVRDWFARRAGWRSVRHGGQVRDLRRIVAWEGSVGIVILVLAGLLMSSAAPVAAPTAASGLFEAEVYGDVFLARFEISPTPTAGGFHDVRVFIADNDTQDPVLDNTCGREDCIQLAWYAEEEGELMSQSMVAEPEGDGWWVVRSVLFATADDYALFLAVQTADVYLDEIQASVTVSG